MALVPRGNQQIREVVNALRRYYPEVVSAAEAAGWDIWRLYHHVMMDPTPPRKVVVHSGKEEVDRHQKFRDRFREKGGEKKDLFHKPAHTPAPTTPAPTPAPTEAAASSVRYRMPIYGTYKGRFRGRVRRVKKERWPVVYKHAFARSDQTASAGHTLYFIHSTHPLRKVMRMIGMAIIHKYYQTQGIWIANWKERAGTETGTPTTPALVSPDLSIYAVLDGKSTISDPEIVVLFETSGLTAPFTWIEMADALANGLINQVTSARTDMFIAKLQFRSPGASSTLEDSKIWDATELSITVTGKSQFLMQNRTVAGDNSAVTTSIESNPIRGKEYNLTGNWARIRDFKMDATGGTIQMVADSNVGLGTYASNSFHTAALNALKQPPTGNYFFNCKGTRYVHMEPGAVKKSVVYKSVTKTLNQWLMSAWDELIGATTIATIAQYGTYSVGASHLIGLEKLVNMGGKSVTVGGEMVGLMKAKAFIRKRSYTAAYND